VYVQTAGPIGTKLGTLIHLDPGSVSVKSRSWSKSIVAAKTANAVGMRMEMP